MVLCSEHLDLIVKRNEFIVECKTKFLNFDIRKLLTINRFTGVYEVIEAWNEQRSWHGLGTCKTAEQKF